MRKIFVIMIAAILLLGVAGCVSIRVSGTQSSSTPEAEVSPTNDEFDTVDIANAANLATSINAYNALNPFSVLPDDVTLEEAKVILEGDGLWPEGLSNEDARKAWKLIVIKDGAAELTPEAQEAMQYPEEPEQTIQGVTGDAQNSLNYANASNLAVGINAYNALNPNSVLPDDITLEGVKEALGEYLWPAKLTDEEAEEAWKLIIYKDGIAELVPEA